MPTCGAFSTTCPTSGWSSSSSIVLPTGGYRRILRLIRKWLKAGVSEEGEWSKTEVGTPQGSVASPLLANIYLHYVFDLWARHWRKHHATGDVIVVRYADDAVVGFEHRADAERFLHEWKARLQKFGTAYDPAQRYASGDYINQNPAPDGLDQWIKRDRPLENSGSGRVVLIRRAPYSTTGRLAGDARRICRLYAQTGR